jgi:hypothetical protein
MARQKAIKDRMRGKAVAVVKLAKMNRRRNSAVILRVICCRLYRHII